MPLSSRTSLLLSAALLLAPAAPDLRAAEPVANGEAAELLRYGQREDVQRFADEVAQRQGLDVAWVRAALERARFSPAVARFIMPAANVTLADAAARFTTDVLPPL